MVHNMVDRSSETVKARRAHPLDVAFVPAAQHGSATMDGMPRIPSSISPRTPPAPRRFERRVPGIEYGVLDTLVGYALRRAQIAIYQDFEATLGTYDMTPQRFSAMVLVGGNDGITQSDLGHALGIARSGVVQLIDSLSKRGWLVREAHRTDARAWTLYLTPEGRAHLTVVRRRVRAHDRRIAGRLSDARRAELIDLLDGLGEAR